MDARKGGSGYCPSCKKIVKTRVLLEGYSQAEYHGIPAKRRHVILRNGRRWFKWLRNKMVYIGDIGGAGFKARRERKNELLGHNILAMTPWYSHLAPEQLQKVGQAAGWGIGGGEELVWQIST